MFAANIGYTASFFTISHRYFTFVILFELLNGKMCTVHEVFEKKKKKRSTLWVNGFFFFPSMFISNRFRARDKRQKLASCNRRRIQDLFSTTVRANTVRMRRVSWRQWRTKEKEKKNRSYTLIRFVLLPILVGTVGKKVPGQSIVSRKENNATRIKKKQRSRWSRPVVRSDAENVAFVFVVISCQTIFFVFFIQYYTWSWAFVFLVTRMDIF